jgi:hypothetical protein
MLIGDGMLLVEEHLVCSCHECRAEFTVTKPPTIQKQSVRCACGNELRKAYHSPVLTVYGNLSEMSGRSGLNGEIAMKLEQQKRLRFNPDGVE